MTVSQIISIGLTWAQLPGTANDIGSGATRNALWAIGITASPGGYDINHWDGSNWNNVPGAAVRIVVDHNGTPFVLNDAGNIFFLNGGNWQQLPGTATDIAVGGNGSLWAIGITQLPGGHDINQWDGSNWNNVPGAAVRIAVDNSGIPWVVNDAGNIFFLNGGNWQQLPGTATAIAVDRVAWVLDTNPVAGGYGIHYWNNSTWVQVQGAAVRIAVSGIAPSIVDTAGQVFWPSEIHEAA